METAPEMQLLPTKRIMSFGSKRLTTLNFAANFERIVKMWFVGRFSDLFGFGDNNTFRFNT